MAGRVLYGMGPGLIPPTPLLRKGAFWWAAVGGVVALWWFGVWIPAFAGMTGRGREWGRGGVAVVWGVDSRFRGNDGADREW